ncbi:unnamed protein product, partial [Mesorhabditis belari]|uniref:Uncharacterized protein n=1 Tax=Mesorhabditis belari TaxID=2138241 RepID=A0AAF3FNQ6_9BILA
MKLLGSPITQTRKSPFVRKTVLSYDFSTGWSLHGVGVDELVSGMEMQRKRVQELAWEVWDKYLKDAKTKPRDALLHLQEATSCIQEFVKSTLMKKKNIEHVQNMVHALTT